MKYYAEIGIKARGDENGTGIRFSSLVFRKQKTSDRAEFYFTLSLYLSFSFVFSRRNELLFPLSLGIEKDADIFAGTIIVPLARAKKTKL